jgi:dihydrofolate reductase
MRKLKLQVQITVDGFVAGPNGELDWMAFKIGHDDKLERFIHALTDSSDTILLGRKMTGDFINYWENVQPDSPEYSIAQKMVNTPKVVFSHTLEKVKGKNVVLAKGNLDDEISSLKNRDGKDIVVYGGAGFVSSLISAGHIDEFNLFINPIMIKEGLRIFDGLDKRQKLVSLGATAYDCGVNVVRYQLNKS